VLADPLADRVTELVRILRLRGIDQTLLLRGRGQPVFFCGPRQLPGVFTRYLAVGERLLRGLKLIQASRGLGSIAGLTFRTALGLRKLSIRPPPIVGQPAQGPCGSMLNRLNLRLRHRTPPQNIFDANKIQPRYFNSREFSDRATSSQLLR